MTKDSDNFLSNKSIEAVLRRKMVGYQYTHFNELKSTYPIGNV
jgi:hypothetical protein